MSLSFFVSIAIENAFLTEEPPPAFPLDLVLPDPIGQVYQLQVQFRSHLKEIRHHTRTASIR